jgi:hypothetical protein
MRAVVKCTKFAKDFEIEIPSSAVDVARYWRQTIEANCPHCGESHLEGFRQLYVQAAVSRGNLEAVHSPYLSEAHRVLP